MTTSQYQNSVKNLVEVYIPEAFEPGTIVYIPPGRRWTLVFQDPSGVLDLWGRGEGQSNTQLDIMDPEFLEWLLNFAKRSPALVRRWRDAIYRIDWHTSI